MALEEKTLPEDFVVDAVLAAAIETALTDSLLPCAVAFRVAETHVVAPLLVGQTADVLGIRLTRCQLGLFGYPGHAKGWDALAGTAISEDLAAAVRAAADEAGGMIACAQLWELAVQFGISRLQMGYVVDQLGLRIGACQLGAF